jgi:hypothetical protein
MFRNTYSWNYFWGLGVSLRLPECANTITFANPDAATARHHSSVS